MKRYALLIYFILILVSLDAFIFRYLIWKLPNESAFDTEPHYSYLHRAKQLAGVKPDDEFRVIVTGSSIAIYSVIEQRLETLLNRSDFLARLPKGKSHVRVYVLAHQGQNSVMLLAALDSVLNAKPDLVIHPVNMVDFRIERPILLGIMDDLSRPEGRGRAIDMVARDLLAFPEVRLTGAEGKLEFFSDQLDPEEWSQTLMSVLFASYRYRDVAAVPLRTFIQNRTGRGHSFLHYAGIPVEGLTRRGHTATEFELVWNDVLEKSGLEFEAPPELFESGERPVLHVKAGSCSCRDCKEVTNLALKRGWQNAQLPEIDPGGRLCFRVTPGYYSSMFDDRYGVRLSRNTGTEEYGMRAFYREKRRDDDLYRGFTAQEYRSSFQKRVLANRAGMEYSNMIRRAKHEWAVREFDPGLPPFRALSIWKERIADCSPLLVVNSPENPISLSWYVNSPWYADYLKYLSCTGACRMEDAKDLLGEGDFYDYHHLGYYGAEKFTDLLGERIGANPDLFAAGRRCAPLP